MPEGWTRVIFFYKAISTNGGDTSTAAQSIGNFLDGVNFFSIGARDDFVTGTSSNATIISLPNILTNDGDANTATPSTVIEVANQTSSVGVPVTLIDGSQVTILSNGNISYNPNGVYDYLLPGQSAIVNIPYTTDDGDGNITTGNIQLTVQGANDTPILNLDPNNSAGGPNDGGYAASTEAGTAHVIADIDALANDRSEADLKSATITVGGVADGASEQLTIGGTTVTLDVNASTPATVGGVVYNIAYTASTGVLTLTRADNAVIPAADMAALLKSVSYNDTNTASPALGDRTFAVTVIDSGGLSSAPVTSTITVVAPGNTPPLVEMGGAGIRNFTTSFTESPTNGTPTPVSIAATSPAVTDATDVNMESARVALTNAQTGDQILVNGSSAASGTIAGGISYSISNSIVSLFGSSSLANYQNALKLITFTNARDDVSTMPRVFETTVNDGAVDSPVATTTINVTNVNDSPVAANDGAADPAFTGLVSSGALSAAGGTSTATVQGSADQTIAISRLDNKAIPGQALGGLGLGAQAGDQLAGASDSYSVGFSSPVTSTTLDISGLDNTAAGAQSIESIKAYDIYGNLIDVAVTWTPTAGAGSTFDPLTGTITANSGVADASGKLTFTSSVPIDHIEITRTTTTGYAASGGGTTGLLSLDVLNYSNAGNTNADYTTSQSHLLNVPAATGLLANDTDPDHDTLTVSAINGVPAGVGTPVPLPGGGIVTVQPDGSLSFDPNGAYDYLARNQTASVTFNYTISDGKGGTSIATATITIVGENDAPTSADATRTILEDATYTFAATDFAFTDTDTGNSRQSVMISTLPANGTLRLGGVAVTAGQIIPAASLGTLTWTPAANSNGTTLADFDFKVGDGIAYSAAVNTFTFNVTPVNDAPSGADKIITNNEDSSLRADGHRLRVRRSQRHAGNTLQDVKIASLPSNGTLAYDGTAITAAQVASGFFITTADIAAGKLVFTPAANANGTTYANFTFQVRDNGGTANGGIDLDASPNTITIDVTAVNDPPVAVNDGPVTVQPGVVISIPVLTNDTDIDNDALAISQINGINIAVGGTVTLTSGTTVTRNADGTLGVVMGMGGFITETFYYSISDGNGGTSTATVTLARDSDGDAIANTIDIDDDNDGVLDTVEGGGYFVGLSDVGGFYTFTTLDSFVGSTPSIASLGQPPGWTGPMARFSDPATGTVYGINNAGVLFTWPSVADAATLAHQTNLGAISAGWTTNSTIWMASGGQVYGLNSSNALVTWATISDFRTNTNPTTLGTPGNGWTSAQSTIAMDVDGRVYGFKIFSTPSAGYRFASLADFLTQTNGVFLGALAGGWNDTAKNQILSAPRDTDGDLLPDYLDIDSDNDGITDNVEAQSTAGYIAPSGNPGAGFTDVNGDGLDDVYDPGALGTAGGIGLTPVNTDGTDNPDYIDTNSDNDSLLDIAERGDGQPASVTSTTDTDRDGLLDIFERGAVSDGITIADHNRTSATLSIAGVPALNATGSNAVPLTTDLFFRDVNNAPVDPNDTGTVTEDVTLTIAAPGLLSSAADADGDTLTITSYTISGMTGTQTVGSAITVTSGTITVGTLTINADGSYSFAPAANYTGRSHSSHTPSLTAMAARTRRRSLCHGARQRRAFRHRQDHHHSRRHCRHAGSGRLRFQRSQRHAGQHLLNVKISALPASGTLLYNGVAITAAQVTSGYFV